MRQDCVASSCGSGRPSQPECAAPHWLPSSQQPISPSSMSELLLVIAEEEILGMRNSNETGAKVSHTAALDKEDCSEKSVELCSPLVVITDVGEGGGKK